MEIKELRKLSTEDIKKKIVETKEELFAKRMKHASGSLDKPVELKTLRRDVARMKTILRERELEGGEK